MKDLVAIAKMLNHAGCAGELVADILTDFPERSMIWKSSCG
jgi:ribosomal 30S subunit maturation factor RimM